MRIPPLIKNVCKLAGITAFVAIAALTAGSTRHTWTKRDKAYYASPNVLNFVRPGLVLKITSANIAQDGTISATFNITDEAGAPLDRNGVDTPGAVSVSCMAAVIPQGQEQYTAYTFKQVTATTNGQTATQAGTDSGGTFASTTDGTYTYTFKTKAPAGFDAHATTSVGCQASRNLTEFELGTNYATNVYSFVPDGSAVTATRDVINNSSCNKCHTDLAFHGGSRRGITYCVMCHTPQSSDPYTGNTLDFKVMIHKIHMGSSLPSVVAGGKYQIVGYQQSVNDFSDVQFPTTFASGVPGVTDCQICHDQSTGATQAKAYMTEPTRAACGSCHDDVNFATGANHAGGLPQVSDANCKQCHIPQGDTEFDASIVGAHTIPEMSSFNPGMNINILKVQNGLAGMAPTVTFTLKDNSGAPIDPASLKASPGRLAFVLAGPTSDYGYTSFGSDVTTPGYVSEDGTGSTCDTTGTCTFTFTHKIPANATGTYSIGAEGRIGYTILPGTVQQKGPLEYGAKNVVVNFSVDGSPVVPRRTVVALSNCNQCHTRLNVHGENRNQIEMCVLCHNPSDTDASTRASATNPADKAAPAQSIDFSFMIHRIHTGKNLVSQGAGYTVVGFGGSHNDFTDVGYPAMTLTGSTGATQICDMCHVNGSEQNLPTGLNNVVQPQGPINPMGAVTAACTGCHAKISDASHALANTTTLGESCDACHGPSAQFNPDQVHAQ
jgi:OmcA/MtrC family decaheme c-type cytochrome